MKKKIIFLFSKSSNKTKTERKKHLASIIFFFQLRNQINGLTEPREDKNDYLSWWILQLIFFSKIKVCWDGFGNILPSVPRYTDYAF